MSGTTKKKAKVGEWDTPPFIEKPDWSLLAETLRDSPMRWLKVYSHGRETWANAVKRGRISAVRPELGFEAKTTDNHRTSPRTCTLWMRYNPDKADPLAELLAGRK